MSNPDDGGPYSLPTDKATEVRFTQPIDYCRFEAAKTFAAAWLPIVDKYGGANHNSYDVIGEKANELGLAMADDLLRRLKEGV